MINKTIGNLYEQRLAELFCNKGYWCHVFSYNQAGQPCDFIAVKDNKVWLLDAKHCETALFTTARIEANQHTCFRYAKECGVENVGFAIYYDQERCFKYLRWEENLKRSYRLSELINLEALI